VVAAAIYKEFWAVSPIREQIGITGETGGFDKFPTPRKHLLCEIWLQDSAHAMKKGPLYIGKTVQ
jgi:hypothetical protein